MATNSIPGQLGISSWDLYAKSSTALDATLADYKALGADWLRIDVRWDHAQKTANGAYNWSEVERVVSAANKHGIEVIGVLNDVPNWADRTFASTSTREAYSKFAKAAASKFGDAIDYWEIYNEPNMKGITPTNYASTLKGAFSAIKSVDAGDAVITGGLAAVPGTGNGLYGAVDYLKGIYAAGGKGNFDAVGYHPYTYPYLPSASASWNGWQIMEDGIRSTMVSNGDSSLEVWMTELGAPTTGPNSISQSTQATIIAQATQIAAGYDWAGPILWYTYQDVGGATGNVENWFGLVGPNGEKKEAYYTFKSIATTQEGGSAGSGTAGSGTVTVSGTSFIGDNNANRITGNDAHNTIYGNGGNDTISGGKGHDTIYGGAGLDRFVFENAATIGWDTIKDFSAGDKIDVSQMDANSTLAGNQSFTFVGKTWLANAGDLGFYQDVARNCTWVQGDLNGDKNYDFSIRVDGLVTFHASDFIL